MRIVIVDDNKTNLMILSRLVSQVATASVFPFSDAPTALNDVRENGCDLLVVDYLMPVLDGLNFIREIRGHPTTADIPAVMVTSEGDREVRKAAVEAGATDFLTKPIDPIEIKARVRNLLQLRRAALRERASTAELRDVVDKLKAANRLREAAERIAGFGSYRVVGGGVLASWSDHLFEIFGMNRAEGAPTFEKVLSLFLPESRQNFADLRETRWKTGIGGCEEFRITRGDGSLRDLQVWIEPEPGEGGLWNWYGVVQDITERKKAEREAVLARERFAELFNLVADGIMISDPATGRYVEANDAACRMFGYTKAELLQCHIGDISSGVHPYTLHVAVARNRLGREGETKVFEWHNKTKDGRLFWCEITLRYVRFGGAPAVLAKIHDISKRKAFEQELLDAKEAAEKASRAKSDFLAVMSHEIRTPMNGVIGMNALLLETDLTPPQRKMSETVRNSADALLHLLDDILDVAKLEAGQVTLEHAPFELPALVENVFELFRPRAAEKGVGLSVNFDPAARGTFEGAPASLRQVLLNLVSNAIKFTQSGGVTVGISSAAIGEGGERLRFEVSDTGIGVPASAKPRLFAAFEQADASISRRFGGSGLGLNICHRLVELMGGDIGMIDRPGGGSLFWFEIEMKRLQNGETKLDQREAGEKAPSVEPQVRRILLAEDDHVNVEVATLILWAAGYQLEVARNGVEAVAAATNNDFDLILMDVRMPQMDGWTATQAIRALPTHRRHTPILALTANASAADRQRSADVGMNDFITKPFAPKSLREVVARWLERAPARGPGEPGGPPMEEEEPVIDAEVVDELRSVMNGDQFAALVKMCIAQGEAQTQIFAHGLLEPKPDEIADLAHKVVSSAGALGARRVQKVAGRLERACRESGWACAPDLIAQLSQATAEANAALRRLLATDEAEDADEAAPQALARAAG